MANVLEGNNDCVSNSLDVALDSEMRTTIIITVLLVGCEHPPQQVSEVAKINATEWEIKSTEWPMGEERVCAFFFGGHNHVACWEQYDELTEEFHNRGDHENDHPYFMKASQPENVKRALAEEQNQKAFCARDESMHLTCPRGGNIK